MATSVLPGAKASAGDYDDRNESASVNGEYRETDQATPGPHSDNYAKVSEPKRREITDSEDKTGKASPTLERVAKRQDSGYDVNQVGYSQEEEDEIYTKMLKGEGVPQAVYDDDDFDPDPVEERNDGHSTVTFSLKNLNYVK